MTVGAKWRWGYPAVRGEILWEIESPYSATPPKPLENQVNPHDKLLRVKSEVPSASTPTTNLINRPRKYSEPVLPDAPSSSAARAGSKPNRKSSSSEDLNKLSSGIVSQEIIPEEPHHSERFSSTGAESLYEDIVYAITSVLCTRYDKFRDEWMHQTKTTHITTIRTLIEELRTHFPEIAKAFGKMPPIPPPPPSNKSKGNWLQIFVPTCMKPQRIHSVAFTQEEVNRVNANSDLHVNCF